MDKIKMMWEMLKSKPTCRKLFNNNYIKFRSLMMRLGLKDFDVETIDVEMIDCYDVDTFHLSITKVLKRNNESEYDGYDEYEVLRNIEYLEKDNSLSNIDIVNKIDILSSTIQQIFQTPKEIKLYNLRMRLI